MTKNSLKAIFAAMALSICLPIAATTSIQVKQGFLTTGVGNKKQVLLMATVSVNSSTDPSALNGLTLNLSGTTSLPDIDKVQVYSTADAYFKGDKEADATLLGTTSAVEDNMNITFSTPMKLRHTGSNYIWITCDISSQATVDHIIDATLLSLTPESGEKISVSTGNPEGTTRIFERQTMLFNPFDAGSEYYRIPAMIVLRHSTTGKNGRIVTVTDQRHTENGDLPNKIDLICRYSDDNGQTWSAPQTIAGGSGQGPDYGYGDAALVETESGKIIIIMAADKRFQESTSYSPIRMYTGSSNDGGTSWATPTDITDIIYGKNYNGAPSVLQAVFVSSGKGLCLQRQAGANATLNGRIMYAMVCKFRSGEYQNYILFSDDEGSTWQISSQSAFNGADEAKLVELEDGSIKISVRRKGDRGFNTSTDGGNTWASQYTQKAIYGNSCNADMLLYTKKILLHTIPNNADVRENLTLYASADNGQTWPYSKVISKLGALYSTMDIDKEGHILLYFEDATMSDHCSMNFLSFPADWIVPQSVLNGLENTEKTDDIKVYVNDKRIVVESDKDYTITDVQGVKYGKHTQLPEGIYLVTVGQDKTIKTIVH